jgi:TPR repeat protein
VAVKVIRLQALADGAEAAFLRERLFREARSAGGLFHPGIVVILDVGQEGDVAYIAMEYVEGPSLFQVLSERAKMDRAEAVSILSQTASALDFAHSHDVVHRDIKPANIMLEKGVTVKVADFGIAKITSQQYTRTGVSMGTPSYMSPEQVDAKPLDGKSDQFSLAVVAYELLTGVKPFRADSFTALAHMIVYGPRPSARAANPDLPAAVDQVIYRGLANLPEERYGNCREFVGALERALTAPAPAVDDGTRKTIAPIAVTREAPVLKYPAVKKKSPRNIYIAAGAIAAIFLAAAGWAYILMTRRPTPGPVSPARVAINTPPAGATAVPAVAAAPVIARFLAEPKSVEAGAQAMLNWEVSGATEVAIEPGIGKRPPADHAPVKPQKSTTYILTATNAGGTVSGETFVEVKLKNSDAPGHARQLYLDGEAKLRARQFAEGLALLRQAAEAGETRAMIELGEIFMTEGNGHTQDEKQALLWFRKAAEAGDWEGMLRLGACYDLGIGVAENDQLAAVWYRKAADSGSAAATFDLGKMYENGRGVPRDPAKARELYERAARMGNAEARRRLTQLGVR